MKDFDAMLLSVVRARARAGAVPTRPVVLCFTADEEAGGQRARSCSSSSHREWLEGLHRGASARSAASPRRSRGRRLYLIEAAEKGMAWMRLTRTGPPVTARCATPTTP